MIEWTGNLKDDCKAEWNGLFLHAEEMDKNYWWWAVSDPNGEQLISSNNSDDICKNGKSARVAAENAAFKINNI
jgi:hypothetical protein